MKKLSGKGLFLTVILAAAGVHGSARQPEGLDQAERRFERFERFMERMPDISGFINFRYQWSDEAGSRDHFDVRRARLDIKGEIGSRVDYRLNLEFANGPKILDAYLRWKPWDCFNLQAGQFKIPFSLENAYGPHTLETIDNSMIITYLCGYSDLSGISANGRDVGLSAYGGLWRRDGYNLLDYAVGVFNGNGINVRDNNGSVDFSGTLYFHPVKSVTVSISHYNGSAKGPDAIDHQRVRTGAGARWDNGKLLVRSEYIHGKTGSIKSQGTYLVGAYFVTRTIQPLVKFDYFHEDTSVSASKNFFYTAGINYLPIRHLRLQLNYTYRHYNYRTDANYLAVQVFGLF